MQKDETTGRIIGLLTFLAGIGLLVFVAVLAYSFFTHTTAVPLPMKDTTTPTATLLGESAIQLFFKIALLIVLTVVGSLLASKGIHLYSVATGNDRHSTRRGIIKRPPSK